LNWQFKGIISTITPIAQETYTRLKEVDTEIESISKSEQNFPRGIPFSNRNPRAFFLTTLEEKLPRTKEFSNQSYHLGKQLEGSF
jgi:hypothetical protein